MKNIIKLSIFILGLQGLLFGATESLQTLVLELVDKEEEARLIVEAESLNDFKKIEKCKAEDYLDKVTEVKLFSLGNDITPITGEQLYYFKHRDYVFVISEGMIKQYCKETVGYCGSSSYTLDLKNKKFRKSNPSCGPADRPRSWDLLSDEEVAKLPKHLIPSKSDNIIKLWCGNGLPEPVSKKKRYLITGFVGMSAATLANLYSFYKAKENALRIKIAKINAEQALTSAEKNQQILEAQKLSNKYAMTSTEIAKMALNALGWAGFTAFAFK